MNMMIIKKIKPMFTGIVTTMHMMEEKDAMVGTLGLIDTSKMKQTIKEFQKVVAIGTNSAGIKEGDLVAINPARFAKMKHQEGSLKDGVITDNMVETFEFDIIEINNKPHLLLDTRDIKYIIEDYEEFDPNPSIVAPESPKIVVD